MIVYTAIRGEKVTLEANDGEAVEEVFPEPSQALANHSPTGFEFGYFGSGPSQLALAILFHYTRDSKTSLRVYREFKEQFIAPEKGEELIVASDDIDEFLKGR